MITAAIALFVWTFVTGPAGQDIMRERRARGDSPRARVTYLPGASCRGNESGASTVVRNEDAEKLA